MTNALKIFIQLLFAGSIALAAGSQPVKRNKSTQSQTNALVDSKPVCTLDKSKEDQFVVNLKKGVCYRYFKEKSIYEDARDHCISLNLDLARPEHLNVLPASLHVNSSSVWSSNCQSKQKRNICPQIEGSNKTHCTYLTSSTLARSERECNSTENSYICTSNAAIPKLTKRNYWQARRRCKEDHKLLLISPKTTKMWGATIQLLKNRWKDSESTLIWIGLKRDRVGQFQWNGGKNSNPVELADLPFKIKKINNDSSNYFAAIQWTGTDFEVVLRNISTSAYYICGTAPLPTTFTSQTPKNVNNAVAANLSLILYIVPPTIVTVILLILFGVVCKRKLQKKKTTVCSGATVSNAQAEYSTAGSNNNAFGEHANQELPTPAHPVLEPQQANTGSSNDTERAELEAAVPDRGNYDKTPLSERSYVNTNMTSGRLNIIESHEKQPTGPIDAFKNVFEEQTTQAGPKSEMSGFYEIPLTSQVPENMSLGADSICISPKRFRNSPEHGDFRMPMAPGIQIHNGLRCFPQYVNTTNVWQEFAGNQSLKTAWREPKPPAAISYPPQCNLAGVEPITEACCSQDLRQNEHLYDAIVIRPLSARLNTRNFIRVKPILLKMLTKHREPKNENIYTGKNEILEDISTPAIIRGDEL